MATLAIIHLNNRPNLGSSKPVDNRPARANTTMVNADSQMSEVTGGRVYLFVLCMAEAGDRCDVMCAMQRATLLGIVLVDAEVVVVTGVVIGET